jgi:hypothetical protein
MIVVTPVPFRGDNFACNLPRKVAIAAMTATIYFRTVRGANVPQSSRATPRRKRGHQAAHALPIARLSIQHSVVLDAPSAAKRFALAKLSPATTAIRLAGLRAMTRLLMGEPDLWWAYHSKIEYPANHRCRIAGFEPAVSRLARAGDVRRGRGGAILCRAACSTSLPLANLAPAARRPSRRCFCFPLEHRCQLS